MLRDVPDKPWEVVGVDIFYFKNKAFLLIVDYFSKFVELVELHLENTVQVKKDLKVNFA